MICILRCCLPTQDSYNVTYSYDSGYMCVFASLLSVYLYSKVTVGRVEGADNLSSASANEP